MTNLALATMTNQGLSGPLFDGVLWTKWHDGPLRSIKATVGLDGSPAWRLLDLVGGTDSLYTDPKALLRSVVGDTKAKHLTLSRYLGVGRYAKVMPEPTVHALDWLAMPTVPARRADFSMDLRPTVGLKPGLGSLHLVPDIGPLADMTTDTVPHSMVLRSVDSNVQKPNLASVQARARSVTAEGIDLGKRGHEVAKLLWAGFGRKIIAAGLDFDDVLQDVHRGILARNAGLSAWDPCKSGFGHYVHMVCGCVLANLLRQHRRLAQNEVVGMPVRHLGQEGSFKTGDVGTYGATTIMGKQDDAKTFLDDMTAIASLQDYATKRGAAPNVLLIIPLVALGLGRGEIATKLEMSPSVVSGHLAAIRSIAAKWKNDQSN